MLSFDGGPERKMIERNGDILLNVNEFSEAARCDRHTVARRLHQAGIQPKARDGKSDFYKLADLIRVTYPNAMDAI
jgi:hypothetical protein